MWLLLVTEYDGREMVLNRLVTVSVLFTAPNIMRYYIFLLTILMGSTGPMLFTYTAASITVGLTRI